MKIAKPTLLLLKKGDVGLNIYRQKKGGNHGKGERKKGQTDFPN